MTAHPELCHSLCKLSQPSQQKTKPSAKVGSVCHYRLYLLTGCACVGCAVSVGACTRVSSWMWGQRLTLAFFCPFSLSEPGATERLG